MADRLVCLDTSVLIKYLTPDEQDQAATALVGTALRESDRLVAPSWAWAEIASVLRKKARIGLLLAEEARQLWLDYLRLPLEFLDTPLIRLRAWHIADQYNLPTLYDAAFLACTELAPGQEDSLREFWTADEELLRSLGPARPAYVHQLGT